MHQENLLCYQDSILKCCLEEDILWKYYETQGYEHIVACFHNRLATKDRLYKISILNEDCCYFCRDKETIQHLMFACEETKKIWKGVLDFLQIDHGAQSQDEELNWIFQQSKGKG